MHKLYFLLLAGLLLLLSSCSDYQKLLKNPDPAVKYEAALTYFEKKDYMRSLTLLQDVTPFYRGTDKAENILYLIATSYFNQRDYISARHYYAVYVTSYPRGKHLEEVKYMNALSYYKESPEPKLDQTASVKGIELFNDFLIDYPKTDKAIQIQILLQELKEKLAEREFISATLYFNIGNYRGNNYYRSAIVTAENAIKDFPASKFREQFAILLVRSKHQEAIQSVETKLYERSTIALDECVYFLQEFPTSTHLKEVQQLKLELEKIINKFT
jgi:outer membrane protein assembly factor BamD